MKHSKIKYSKHVLERMKKRGISKKDIAIVLEDPDSISYQGECKEIYQKKFIQNQNDYLIRIFVNICKSPPLIITTYKTSKVGKYED